MRRYTLMALVLLLKQADAETFFPHRVYDYAPVVDTDATTPIAWLGSSTAFVGFHSWPPDRKPLVRINGPFVSGGQLVAVPDFTIVSCDATTFRCTAATEGNFGRNLEMGGLPDGTEVKFMSTGTLPGGLIAWEQDQHKKYYIREWSEWSFQVAETPGGPAVELTADAGSGTHGMSFAGYSQTFTLRAVKGVEFVCDPETDICTSMVPHLKSNATNNLSRVGMGTSGTFPGGIPYNAAAGDYVQHCMVVLNDMQFRLKLGSSLEPDCLNGNLPVVDITDAGSGVHYLYTNSTTTSSGSPYGTVYIWSVSGYPAGTMLSWRFGSTATAPFGWNPTGGRRPYTNSGDAAITIVAKIPAVTPAGDYPVTITTSESQTAAVQSASYNFTLKAVEISPVNDAGPSTYPPIPGHLVGSSALSTGQCSSYNGAGDCSWATWENIMVADTHGGGSATGAGPTPGATAGYRRCTNRTDPDFPQGTDASDPTKPYDLGWPSIDAKVWYYNNDAFFRIAEYTGDPNWANCGLAVARAFRDKFLVSPGVLGNRYFPWTLAAAYGWTGDPSFRMAAIRIADAGNNRFGTAHDFGIRENAYAFERRLAKRALTGDEDYDLAQFADAALGHIYINATLAPERMFQEPFMIGLAARPLIAWYAISHDERVPYVLRTWMDTMWDLWYHQGDHHLLYNTEPMGLRCGVSCRNYTGSNLNNLVSPMFAWYWRLTGEEQYRERGDDMFANQYRDGYPYNAKEWSQGFYWSFDFVEWRLGTKPAY